MKTMWSIEELLALIFLISVFSNIVTFSCLKAESVIIFAKEMGQTNQERLYFQRAADVTAPQRRCSVWHQVIHDWVSLELSPVSSPSLGTQFLMCVY